MQNECRKTMLPKGWRFANLGDICDFIRGVSFDTSDASYSKKENYVPVLRAGNIGNGLTLNNDLIWVAPENVAPEQYLKQGDIVICMSSGSPAVVGKTSQLNVPWIGSIGAFCGIIRPKDPVYDEWLGYWFASADFLMWRDEQARGANIQNLRFSQFEALQIPMPPSDENKRIVAILNEQIATVEKARKAAEEQLSVIGVMPSALLRKAFRGEI